MLHKTDSDLEKLESAVLSSAKYQHITPEFIRSLGKRELAKRRNWKEAVKAVKNKLHQVGGAYQTDQMRYPEFLTEIQAIGCETEAFKDASFSAMRRHASTRERLPYLEEFYSSLFQELPPIHSVLDVACGLNPLARPWMPLPPDSQYFAVDVYRDLADFLQAYLQLCGIPGQAWAGDVIESPPQNEVDLALVLKSIPCLEQVDKQAGARLLDSLQARFLVVSFPVLSLGGREVGMGIHYPARFQELAAARRLDYQRFNFPGEITFLVTK
jgi:16S rRNA (guanine(1405)-N(7))-methyltransferase